MQKSNIILDVTRERGSTNDLLSRITAALADHVDAMTFVCLPDQSSTFGHLAHHECPFPYSDSAVLETITAIATKLRSEGHREVVVASYSGPVLRGAQPALAHLGIRCTELHINVLMHQPSPESSEAGLPSYMLDAALVALLRNEERGLGSLEVTQLRPKMVEGDERCTKRPAEPPKLISQVVGKLVQIGHVDQANEGLKITLRLTESGRIAARQARSATSCGYSAPTMPSLAVDVDAGVVNLNDTMSVALRKAGVGCPPAVRDEFVATLEQKVCGINQLTIVFVADLLEEVSREVNHKAAHFAGKLVLKAGLLLDNDNNPITDACFLPGTRVGGIVRSPCDRAICHQIGVLRRATGTEGLKNHHALLNTLFGRPDWTTEQRRADHTTLMQCLHTVQKDTGEER